MKAKSNTKHLALVAIGCVIVAALSSLGIAAVDYTPKQEPQVLCTVTDSVSGLVLEHTISSDGSLYIQLPDGEKWQLLTPCGSGHGELEVVLGQSKVGVGEWVPPSISENPRRGLHYRVRLGGEYWCYSYRWSRHESDPSQRWLRWKLKR